MHPNPWINALASLYQPLLRFGSNLQSLFLLYMRLVWGHQFFLAGMSKFGSLEQTAQFFASLNIPFPHFTADAVATCEAVGGLLLIVGLASRLAALPLIAIMLAALSTAHAASISNFRFLFEPLSLVRQAPYPFLITALLVFIFGPGRVSLDAWIKRWFDQTRV